MNYNKYLQTQISPGRIVIKIPEELQSKIIITRKNSHKPSQF